MIMSISYPLLYMPVTCMLNLCREATKSALQLPLAEKEAAEKAAHNYKANPVPANLRRHKQPVLPQPNLTVSCFLLPHFVLDLDASAFPVSWHHDNLQNDLHNARASSRSCKECFR